jgi:hypothetical protein
MMVKFTYCKNFASAETRETDWEPFAKALTTFKAFPSKEASVGRAAFVGGLRADEDKGRADGNIVSRTVATLDFDAPQGTLDEIEFALDLALPCAFVAYSTFRHTPDVPRFRLCVPLSRPVNEAEYRRVVAEIVDLVGLGPVDNCSFVMSQLMFLPSNREGVTPWSMRRDGEPWACQGTQISISVRDRDEGFDAGDDLGDFAAIVAAEPLDIGLSEIDALLENYPAEGKDYDEWLRVGMALYHQFRGGEEGWRRWTAWSIESSKHDARQMRTKWRSFGGSAKPVTMASIIHLAGGRRAAVEIAPSGSTYAALEAEARGLRSLDDYTELRNKVSALSDTQLRADMRSVLAATIHKMFGKVAGLTLSEVKRALKPAKGSRRSSELTEGVDGEVGGPFDGPDWLSDWVFCESDATFEMVSVRHSIKREAFRARFDRMPEVMMAEVPDAANFALTYCRIPTVASKMFWPGAERIFTLENQLKYLNTYERSGAEPCDEMDDEGREIMNRFMIHVANTIGSDREQRVLIDFMAYVYQNPGKRVQWALLVKGIEGNGKSYFFKVMQAVLGRQASVVSTTAIDSSFTGWAEGSVLVCIEEIRISGVNKYAILDKMKPLITNPTIAVVHKGKDEKHIPNFTSYMMFTNHADAIPVGDNDRRYCVIFTRQTRKEELFAQHGGVKGVEDYFKGLFDDLERRPDVFARMLSDWEISADFSPSGRAPETEGLSDMRAMHISEDRDNIESALADYACAVVGPDIVDVTYLKALAIMDGRDFPQTKAIGHILSDMGYTPVEGRKVKITKTRANHYVWFRRGALSPTGEALSPNDVKNSVRDFHSGEKDFTEAPF